MTDYETFLSKALYPCVRVRAGNAGGSGQVIFADERSGTFVLTCEHVVDGAISVKDEWSPLLQRQVKRDVKSPVTVEFFLYRFETRAVGSTAVEADIVAYDKNEDIALLRLRGDPRPEKHVASLLPAYRMSEQELAGRINYFSEVITVGAALGSDPVATVGNLCGFSRIIDNREYWLCTAPSIFGNSGGATFLTDTFELVGMPARISVSMAGFAADPITHMGYIVPITRIYQFFRDQMMDFLIDPNTTYDECMERIKERRRLSELEMLVKKPES